MNTTTVHTQTPKMSVETARALLDDALEAGKRRNVAEPARKRVAKDKSLPLRPEVIAEAGTAVPEQEQGCATL